MAGNKTEKPTAQRLRKAREDGQFLSSRGLLGAVEFLVFVALAGKLVPAWSQALEHSMSRVLQNAMRGEIGSAEWPGLLRGLFIETLAPLGVLGAVLLAAPLAVHLSITRLGFSLGRLAPDLKRLNPVSRLRDMPAQNLKATLEAVALLGALTLALYSFWRAMPRCSCGCRSRVSAQLPRKWARPSKACSGRRRRCFWCLASSTWSSNIANICPGCA